MKKFMLTAAMAVMSMTLIAQENEEGTPTDKYSVSTNSFTSNWFFSLNGTYSNFMDGGAGNGLMDSPVWGGSVALGKWFTPGLGLRAKMNGWTIKNSHFATSDRHNSYWTLTGDVLFNITNLFKGYNEQRVWNIIPYVAAGAGRNCTLNHYVPVFGAGILSTWKVAAKVDINLECSYKAMSNDFGGNLVTGERPSSADRMFAIEAGITYRLGKTQWKKVPDVNTIETMTQMEIDALNAQIADLEAENERLRNHNNTDNGNSAENNGQNSDDNGQDTNENE